MPPGRTTRRLVSNENDENSNYTRMTRAKAAALDANVLSQPTKQQPLQSKKSAVNVNPAGQHKRAALGDVTNAGKTEVAEGKKPLATKTGLVSKAAQPSGVQKSLARTTSTRAALASKEVKKTEPKRAGSGSGAIGAASQKRKVASATTIIKADAIAEDEEPVRKKVHTLESENIAPSGSKSKLAKVEEVVDKVPDKVSEKVSEKASRVESEVEQPKPHVYPEGVKNLDDEDLDDPLMAAEYATEIFEYLRDLECKSIPNPDYMSHQDDLEWKTRGILIDWLIEVHTRFHLLPETLFLAINIIDRFLSEKVVQLDRLQLVGITAMFIASKYEEVLSPHVTNFVHVADDGFTEAEILSAERFILGTLNYDLSYPNPMNFLRRISKADNYDIQSRTIGKYLMEISLLDYRFMAYRPSHVAAAAMYLSRLILDRGEWDETLSYYAGYDEQEIEPVFELMVDYLARPVIHEAFYKKYASKKFMKASLLTRQWAKKNAPLFGITDTSLSLDEIP
ncbi:G2/mitotic-specific cyclin-B [Pseudomassariella vexata]|uniref:G2/mitotic-specific cyclin-B n=1 Tax=Pseudomassariella vexata TaxID=1141098 RepID=A0A1Y2DSR9_9PEZI|nr:G2/mitotic-specific cyclin-B [Pseudomassariella vexata]ORY62297.1 G2/mitotic-specific cyclin-B [Pseudomassariella vexata]